MKGFRALLLRLMGIVPSQRREQDFASELDCPFQLHIDDNIRSGMASIEARREAILILGGVEMAKQAYRDQATVPFLKTLLQDLRFGIRQLCKNPGFAVTAILMLALDMCASVAIFAFVDAALIKPLPCAKSFSAVQHGTSQLSRRSLSLLHQPSRQLLSRSSRCFG